MNKKIFIITCILFIVDQFTKTFFSLNFALNYSFVVIPNFFSLTYVQNYGASFSLFYNQRLLLIIISIIMLIMLYFFRKKFILNKRNIFAFGCLYAGILGNLFDRVIKGFVIDFLDFKIFSYNYPVFNIADILIVLGVIFIIYAIIRGEEIWK